MSTKALFLDRDGVLNYSLLREDKPYPPQTLEEFIIYDDAFTVLNELKEHDFTLIVITNQPDIASGKQSLDVVEAMHHKLMRSLPLDHILMCTDINSLDYKPNPGMLLRAAKELDISLNNSYLIGDRWRDIGAGIKAGCYKNILLERKYAEDMLYKPDYICETLTEAKDYILEQERLK